MILSSLISLGGHFTNRRITGAEALSKEVLCLYDDYHHLEFTYCKWVRTRNHKEETASLSEQPLDHFLYLKASAC